jgi:hypothetical protein
MLTSRAVASLTPQRTLRPAGWSADVMAHRLWILITLCCLARLAAAEVIPFGVVNSSVVIRGGVKVVTADLDRDGLVDYVTASELDNLYVVEACYGAMVVFTSGFPAPLSCVTRQHMCSLSSVTACVLVCLLA